MRLRTILLPVSMLAATALTGCAPYAYGPPPPPPGWAGEGWARHVVRCERHYPRYDPRTDSINRPDGSFRCPL